MTYKSSAHHMLTYEAVRCTLTTRRGCNNPLITSMMHTEVGINTGMFSVEIVKRWNTVSPSVGNKC
jgi:hypothetical protein